MNEVNVPLRLRIYRDRAGLTQKEAAAKSSVHEKTISSYESGARVTSMKLTHLAMLCVAYGVGLDEFLSPKNRIEEGECDERPFVIEERQSENAEVVARQVPIDPLRNHRPSDDSRYPAPQSSLARAM